jgi:hypothetical protein
MHSTLQDSRCEGGDAEVFSSLRLAGFDGICKAVLDESRLLLERRTGHTLNIRLESIARMRHHTTPLVPRWLFGIGLFLIYAAWRVFIPPTQYWFFGSGGLIVLIWAMGRRPTLTIDSNDGDCHTLFGNDASLMRLAALVHRLQDGQSLEEAREGLLFLSREADYPGTKAIVDQLIQENEPEPLISNPSISTIINEGPKEVDLILPPQWTQEAVGATGVSIEPEHREALVEPNTFSRAREAQEQMIALAHSPEVVDDPWAMANVQPPPTNVFTQPLHTQQENDSTQSFSMFSEGGLFDSPSQTQIPTQPQQVKYQQPFSSQQMILDAQRPFSDSDSNGNFQESVRPTTFIPTFLPPLTADDPERDLIQVEPTAIEDGLVEEIATPLVASAQLSEDKVIQNGDSGGRYPQIQKLVDSGSQSRLRRIKVRANSTALESKRGMRGRVLPGLGKLAQMPKKWLEKSSNRLRSGELLRMEANRNRESQLLKEIQNISELNDGMVAEDLERILQRHRASIQEEEQVPTKFSELVPTTESDNLGVAGLPRLDSNN